MIRGPFRVVNGRSGWRFKTRSGLGSEVRERQGDRVPCSVAARASQTPPWQREHSSANSGLARQSLPETTMQLLRRQLDLLVIVSEFEAKAMAIDGDSQSGTT